MAVLHAALDRIFHWDYSGLRKSNISKEHTYIVSCGYTEKIKGKDTQIRKLLVDNDINILYESPWCHNHYYYHKAEPKNRQKVFIFELKDTVESNSL